MGIITYEASGRLAQGKALYKKRGAINNYQLLLKG